MLGIGFVSRLLLIGLVLTALLTASGVAAAAAETPDGEDGHGTDNSSDHETTTVATDEPFSGFTLGAGLVAVLVGGAYQYLRD